MKSKYMASFKIEVASHQFLSYVNGDLFIQITSGINQYSYNNSTKYRIVYDVLCYAFVYEYEQRPQKIWLLVITMTCKWSYDRVHVQEIYE